MRYPASFKTGSSRAFALACWVTLAGILPVVDGQAGRSELNIATIAGQLGIIADQALGADEYNHDGPVFELDPGRRGRLSYWVS